MFDYREEMYQELYAEDPGAEAARRHNEWEAHWERLAEEAGECRHCGDVGYTIEVNDEGVEYMEGCFDCFVAAHEKEAA